MEASRLVTVESTASRISRLLRKSHFLPNQSPLQQWFETLLEGAKERWVYAIYWKYSSAASLLCLLDQRNRKVEERKKIVLIGKLTRKLYKKSLNILEYKVTKSKGRKVKAPLKLEQKCFGEPTC